MRMACGVCRSPHPTQYHPAFVTRSVEWSTCRGSATSKPQQYLSEVWGLLLDWHFGRYPYESTFTS